MAARLKIEGLTLRFGGLTALDDLTLSCEPGEVLGLAGPNGSGKSSLINVITGHYRAEGRIRLNDLAIDALSAPDRVRRGITRSFQVPRLYQRMSIAQNLDAALHALRPLWPSPAARRRSRARLAEVLAIFGLTDKADLLPAQVSAFDLRLLELARAHLINPALLLLDEPAAGATAQECDRLMFLLSQHLLPGRTTLLIEHRLDVMRQLCPRMVVLQAGRTLADGPSGSVLSQAEVRRTLLGEVPDAA
jgi:branched-chain amino acid transport system ATP-binding protein